MNKEQLMSEYFAFLEKENLQAKDVLVGAGGSLLMQGLREETQDIDIGLRGDLFSVYLQRGLKQKDIGPSRVAGLKEKDGVISRVALKYNEVIDLHDDHGGLNGFMLEGVFIETLDVILERKLRLNREKDQADIVNIRKALAKGI